MINTKVDIENLLTVAQYAKKNGKLTREDIYYYISKGRLKSVKIANVIFINKNEKIVIKPKKFKKQTISKVEKRIANSKKYLSKIKEDKN